MKAAMKAKGKATKEQPIWDGRTRDELLKEAYDSGVRAGRDATARREQEDRKHTEAAKTLEQRSPYLTWDLEEQARFAMSSLRVVEGMLSRAEESGFLPTEHEAGAAGDLLRCARRFLDLFDWARIAIDRYPASAKGGDHGE